MVFLIVATGDMMYCVDILDALTRDFFARKGNPIEEAVELNEVQVALDRPGYEPVSSTLWRQREEYCARLIQTAWRKHKHHRAISQQDSRTDDTEDKFTTSVVLEEGEGSSSQHKVVIHSRSPSITSRMTDV